MYMSRFRHDICITFDRIRDRLVKFLMDETRVVFMECFCTAVLTANMSDSGIEIETILVIMTYFDGRKAIYTIKNWNWYDLDSNIIHITAFLFVPTSQL